LGSIAPAGTFQCVREQRDAVPQMTWPASQLTIEAAAGSLAANQLLQRGGASYQAIDGFQNPSDKSNA
jgi:hypothetical protein